MVDTDQQTTMQVLSNPGTAPGLGAQVICMALISRGHMPGAVSVDGQDCQFVWSPMTPVGCSPRGLLLSLMLVSFPLRWRAAVRCVSCGCSIFPTLLVVPIADYVL